MSGVSNQSSGQLCIRNGQTCRRLGSLEQSAQLSFHCLSRSTGLLDKVPGRNSVMGGGSPGCLENCIKLIRDIKDEKEINKKSYSLFQNKF